MSKLLHALKGIIRKPSQRYLPAARFDEGTKSLSLLQMNVLSLLALPMSDRELFIAYTSAKGQKVSERTPQAIRMARLTLLRLGLIEQHDSIDSGSGKQGRRWVRA
jgi:hypothetical protein